jgi:hypothetical protein
MDIPAYSDLQIALFLAAVVAALVFVVVIASTGVAGGVFWIVTKHPPGNWFVRMNIVLLVVVLCVGVVVVVISNLVSPNSGGAYWLPVLLALITGGIAVGVILGKWRRTKITRP